MPKLAYRSHTFQPGTLQVIAQCNTIIVEYQRQGLTLTLRQLYYQLVSRGLLPENTQKQYKRVGSIVDDARMAGLIDWRAIEDRTRFLRRQSYWEDPAHAMNSISYQYKTDLWEGQPYRIEVWLEKEALTGVFESICNELRVPYFACKGYTSQSEMWEAAQRFAGYLRGGQQVYILHFGDHDPSGIDMSRDIRDRLCLFMGQEPKFKRCALNIAQVRRYNPPPNFAKETDSRGAGYIEKYGSESWELDALDPATLAALVRSNVRAVLDRETWAEHETEERNGKKLLEAMAEHQEDVKEFLISKQAIEENFSVVLDDDEEHDYLEEDEEDDGED